ncbi:MAG: XdhC family protein [Actinomycetota bacterium]|nr:XdhC family protein [Actinomycetota bacterium]
MVELPVTDTLAEIARRLLDGDRTGTITARVVDIQGFSTWAGDELVVVDRDGVLHGSLLGSTGAAEVLAAARPLLEATDPRLATAVVEVHGAAVMEAGLSCGGRAELLLQPTETIPPALWELLARRMPAALLTRLEGPGRGATSQVVGPDGRCSGALDPPAPAAVEEAGRLLSAGHSATRRISDGVGEVLVEVWVPAPRLVVVGSGELVGALRAQGALLGWDLQEVGDRPGADGSWPTLDQALAWAGGSAALVVLSHDPHVDVPALSAGLDADLRYLGAMGSRRTQSRRLERLVGDGRGADEVARIHRPIGLDLGGRSAAEVSLAICAEVLAVHCGRDARPLGEHSGPINDRPTADAVPA